MVAANKVNYFLVTLSKQLSFTYVPSFIIYWPIDYHECCGARFIVDLIESVSSKNNFKEKSILWLKTSCRAIFSRGQKNFCNLKLTKFFSHTNSNFTFNQVFLLYNSQKTKDTFNFLFLLPPTFNSSDCLK